MQQQRRSLFPGTGLSSESSASTLLNFQSSSGMNSMLQAKQELRDTTSSLDLSENTEESIGGRKRRPEHQDLMSQHQMGSYLLQSSTGATPASHGQIPANFWMVANSNNQVMSGDPIWTFPSVNNSAAALYRGTMSSGLHFMNFPPPVALMPTQQLGSGIGSGGGGGGSNSLSEGHLNMLAGFNPYRPMSGTSVSESQASGSHSHHGGSDDRHDTNSHHS